MGNGKESFALMGHRMARLTAQLANVLLSDEAKSELGCKDWLLEMINEEEEKAPAFWRDQDGKEHSLEFDFPQMIEDSCGGPRWLTKSRGTCFELMVWTLSVPQWVISPVWMAAVNAQVVPLLVPESGTLSPTCIENLGKLESTPEDYIPGSCGFLEDAEFQLHLLGGTIVLVHKAEDTGGNYMTVEITETKLLQQVTYHYYSSWYLTYSKTITKELANLEETSWFGADVTNVDFSGAYIAKAEGLYATYGLCSAKGLMVDDYEWEDRCSSEYGCFDFDAAGCAWDHKNSMWVEAEELASASYPTLVFEPGSGH